jgi:hypothetical protein
MNVDKYSIDINRFCTKLKLEIESRHPEHEDFPGAAHIFSLFRNGMQNRRSRLNFRAIMKFLREGGDHHENVSGCL